VSNVMGIARDHLRAYIERIERMEEEKKSIADDIRDIYAEAKANGFDTKALRAIVRRRAQDADKLAEHEAILGLYMHALGMVDGSGNMSAAGQAHLDAMSKKQERREERAHA